MANTAGQWHALTDCYGQNRQAATLVFLMSSTPSTLNPTRTIRCEAQAYQLVPVEIEVTNPFPTSASFKVSVTQSRQVDRAHVFRPASAGGGGQWHALTSCYGQHRRPVARSN